MQKRQDIELLRLVSSLGIVWFHSQAPGRPLAYGALIIFLAMSMYLGGSKPLSAVALQGRAKRILLPWLIWFAVYAAVNLIKGVPAIPLAHGVIAGILSGPRIHLWFMPFIFICLVLFDVARAVVPGRILLLASLALFLILLGSTSIWRPWSMDRGTPVLQYAHAAAGICLGVVLYYSESLTTKVKAVMFAALLLTAASAFRFIDVAVPYVVGVVAGICLVTTWARRRITLDVTYLSSCSLGIYFIHPIFLTLLEDRLPRGTYGLALSTIVLSTLSVLVLRRLAPRLARYWS